MLDAYSAFIVECEYKLSSSFHMFSFYYFISLMIIIIIICYIFYSDRMSNIVRQPLINELVDSNLI